jgi:omega-6 fatty acid desaturase (delta-12 desaturase)
MCKSVSSERTPLMKRQRAPARQPTDAPPFTIGQLRKAVPPHCFERSLPRSLSHLLADLLMVAALAWASSLIDAAPAPGWLRWGALWPAYWWLQGAVATGVWVIAHECGHQAFSESQAVNDGLGLLLHTALLVPYYSWKHSHRRHHSNTSSVARDEVFVPEARERPHDGFEFEQLLPMRIAKLAVTLTLGWPLYLLMNVSSRPYSHAWVSHFDPW